MESGGFVAVFCTGKTTWFLPLFSEKPQKIRPERESQTDGWRRTKEKREKRETSEALEEKKKKPNASLGAQERENEKEERAQTKRREQTGRKTRPQNDARASFVNFVFIFPTLFRSTLLLNIPEFIPFHKQASSLQRERERERERRRRELTAGRSCFFQVNETKRKDA